MIAHLSEEKEKIEENLRQEILLNEEQRNLIEILKQSIESEIIKNNVENFNMENFIENEKMKSENEKIKKELILEQAILSDLKTNFENLKNENANLNSLNVKYEKKM
jgi:hypothetical protein